MIAQKEQQVTIYSDEASMANGNGNGDIPTLIVVLVVVEEASNVLIPQALAQPTPPLFEDQRIFVWCQFRT